MRKQAAQQEGYTGRFWSSEYQPKNTEKVWYLDSAEPNRVYWKPDILAKSRADLPFAVYDKSKEQQTYWDDPTKIGHWHDFLSVQDDDYEPPAWMDADGINSIYKELKAVNGNEDWRNWKPLPFGSVGLYQSQMMQDPFGGSPNYQLSTRKQTLYEKRLPTILGNLCRNHQVE